MNEKKGLLKVDLQIQNFNEITLFKAYISNIGTAEIELDNTYLFVDEGIYNDEKRCYDFPFIQKKHLKIEGVADEDCIASSQCKNGNAVYPLFCPHIEEFYKNHNVFYNCYKLSHLSSQSILYMAPKEVFTEELALRLDKGVYRAILVCVPNPKSCDCTCCNRNFFIQ